jgi:hypothetical protein
LLQTGAWRLVAHGAFDVRGQYGQIPPQTPAVERDYEWWTAGRVGFWQYHVEGGLEAAFRERIVVRLTLTTHAPQADRDFAVWGDGAGVGARLKEASIRLERIGFEGLSLAGGRLPVEYPLFTVYDYAGGQLTWTASPWMTLDWGQWQVFEGRTVDRPGESSDDIDLWGPQVRIRTPHTEGGLYILIHSKAGGSDGIGHNVKIAGLSGAVSWGRLTRAALAGVLQRGEVSTPMSGARRIRAWALHGQAQGRLYGRLDVGGAYWAGSGDRPGTPGIDEGFQSLGYRNTLEKFTLFYRSGLTDIRLFTAMMQGSLARFTGRLDFARIGRGSAGASPGKEVGLTLEYPYSDHARLRWRWGTTFDGHRMQRFEMSAGF